MKSLIRRYGFVAASAVLLLTAGCFQSVSSDTVPTLESQPFVTNTPFPTFTPLPTYTPFPTQDFTAQESVVTVPETTGDTVESFDAEPEVSQASDLQLTATFIVGEATQRWIRETQTAEAPFLVPTFTPTNDPFVVQPTATTGPVFFGSDCVHEVVQGENLYRLSVRYGVLVNDIARASGITNIELISVGQRLTIPGCGTTGQVPPPTSIPTGTVSDGGTVIQTPVPSAGGVRHIVQQGETLFEISLRYGVPVNSIASANGISNINMIFLNQELIIP